ncbi:MAG: hypothetical protein HY231_09130 [Acidobacteria bacterium]|nr:hypothetical protein [Acidobacteriota bacterium]
MMKFLLIFLLFVNWQPGAPVKEVSLGEEFTIQAGEQVLVKDANLKLTFSGVPEDSRCPVDVACVWAGNAKLNLALKSAKKKLTTTINTTLEPRELAFKGYTIKLVRVNPPRKSGMPIAPDDYEATLVVRKTL